MSHPPWPQRGMSTLVTVMLLFFVMALVAAYANRNLIVEQRIAQTFQALGIASEANHQAMHRLISLLNSGNIDGRCRPDPDGPGTLRQRLLVFDADGQIKSPPAARNDDAPERSPFTVICDRVRPGDWQCQCPTDLRPLAQADDAQPRESAVMRIRPLGGAAGSDPQGIARLGLSVQSCAGPSAGCLDPGQSELALVARVQALLLLSALKMPPVNALVARGEVDLGGGMAVVHNEPSHGGLPLQAGGLLQGSLLGVQGPAGSSADDVLVSDPSLAGLDEEAFFRRFFGMAPADYITQPAMRRLQCPADSDSDCTAALKALIDGGNRLIWHDGDLRLSSPAELGSSALPLLLVVRGALRIDGPLRMHGLLAVRDALSWRNLSADASVVQGAVLVGGAVSGDAGATALFDGAILDRLALHGGSFIPLPGGSWSRSW